ncbi:hypothetical protein ACEUZ9_000854 [Paracoccus litorisediminis]|uniref:hypothetical protein n=1 Tax=Paracoccus litorisediminis TaxID=2006130 RepID=UPI00372EF518
MAYAKLYLTNPRTGMMREAPVGFSWTVLFFGFFPALFRKDWAGFAIILICSFLTFGLSNLVFMFIYNKWYLKGLIKDGYEVKSGSADAAWIQQRLGLQLPMLKAA